MQQGMRSMREDGMRLVATGKTSLEELLRVTRE
jgi:general secretion pathway protein E